MSTETVEERFVWGYAEFHDAEEWQGMAGEREEAVKAGAEDYEGRPFYIRKGKAFSPLRILPGAYSILERMRECAADESCPDFVEDPVIVKEGGEDALDELLTIWANTYVECQWWEPIGEAELVDPERAKREAP